MEISNSITPEFIDNATKGYERRLYHCLYVRGTHFEHLIRRNIDVDDDLYDDVVIDDDVDFNFDFLIA